MFPIGRFEACLCTPEIEYALARGHIKSISECAVYEKAVIFKEYVEFFHNLRCKAKDTDNDVLSMQCKLFMNTLSGKWGQRGMFYEKVEDTNDKSIQLWTEIDGETGDVIKYRQYAGIIEQLSVEGESRDSFPAIYAHITAHGRIQIHGHGQVAGLGNFYYMDTDSVWTNLAGYNALRHFLHESDLGRLKLEDTPDNVTLFAPKDYVIDKVARTKGIRAKARKLADNCYEQDKFSTLVGLLRKGDLSAPIVTKVIKHLKRNYTKGIVTDSGRVIPLRINTA